MLIVQDALPTRRRLADAPGRAAAARPARGGNVLPPAARVPTPARSPSATSRRWAGASPDARRVSFENAQALDALDPGAQLQACTFDNVCSCLRRSVWEQIPFRATVIAEDLEWARRVLQAGHSLEYVADAVVVHSHDRSAGYELARTYLLHHRLFELFGVRTIPARARSPAGDCQQRPAAPALRAHGARGGAGRRRMVARARARRRLAARPVSRRARGVQGLPAGAVAGRLMRVLVIAHGFPPQVQGGSEIYAHDHARALRERCGDEVFVLTREQDASRPEYDLRLEDRDGLRVAWVNNTFRATTSFEDSYRNPAIARIAERLVDEWKPDVAHAHHLTCLSTEIVDVLASRRIPIVYTLHDYWLLCHRGQRLDTSYRVCDGPGPDGCGACVHAGADAPIPAGVGAGAARRRGTAPEGGWRCRTSPRHRTDAGRAAGRFRQRRADAPHARRAAAHRSLPRPVARAARLVHRPGRTGRADRVLSLRTRSRAAARGHAHAGVAAAHRLSSAR